MKRAATFSILFFLLALLVSSTIIYAAAEPSPAQDWQTYRFHIAWGIKSKTKHLWDGHAEIDLGKILYVTPFLRHEIIDDAMLVNKTSWHSTTYLDIEGIFLTVNAPENAKVSIYTKTHNFSFIVGEMTTGKTRQELDGDIEITNCTDKLLFRIAGLEKGVPGKGTATISPAIARANTLGTWTLTYTAPEGGLPVGGGIRVSWHFTRSWGQPQFSNPQDKNYVTIKTTGKSRLDYTSEHQGLLEYPFTLGRILVRIFDEPLREGEKIIITLGDKSKGSPGFEAPVVSEQKCVIRVQDCTEVPQDDFPVYRRIKELPWVKVLPLEPQRFFVVAPSIVQAGKPFNLKMVVEDAFRNVVNDFEGQLEILIDNTPLRQLTMKREDSGMLGISGLVLETPGAHWITVKQAEGSLLGESNPIKCVAEAPANQLVWGELHGHTEYSDGYGTLDDYFRFCRERALLDFAAATDHDVELDAPDYHVREMWQTDNTAVKQHNDPPEFCTIPTYEWSPARTTISTVAPFGDHNVFYEREDMPIFQACDPDASTLPKLYQKLNDIQHSNLTVIPHVGGAVANWEYHDPKLESLGEIFSVHGGFENFGEIALQKGYLIGFVGASDSHSGQVGGFPPGYAAGHYTHGGLTAAYVPKLTREDLFASFKKRSVYATSGVRITLDFNINKQPMGSVIETDTTPLVEAEVIGKAPLLSVEVVKNGKVIHTWLNEYRGTDNITLLWGNRVEKDDLIDFDESLWSYYLRFVDWAGGVKAVSGKLTQPKSCSFDYPKDSITAANDSEIQWTSQTRGDWDGVAFQLRGDQSKLQIQLGEYKETVALAELEPGLNRKALDESDRLLIVKGTPQKRQATLQFKDYTILLQSNYYYLRVLQADGEMAWSSPIWIQKESASERR